MLTIPRIVNRTAQRYIAVRLPVSIPFGDDLDPAFDALFSAFASAGVEPNGMEFIKFNLIDMPRLEIEVGMTTNAAIPLSGRLIEGELPAGRYASLTHTGSYAELMDVTAMLVGWAKEKGLKWDSRQTPDGETFACRLEVHENNPSIEPDPARLQTTLLFKLAD
ncbi:GyrI-like domain-containing protein [Pseudoduganella plicata]|uniref:AraC family transcriptional regulator n=1 Tax=Pseudoduganella plicata TaxID=321984 RepID=A0A4P7BDF7_9BURK|nr:GyrI-like domain-containing protein [Pseudoduganella plicata]QBQ36183.1 AraC family transcriptional regulator [Pseudoduganella plicata]GGY77430.1 DNA gyrase inhibitor [Pseudoduganella plicata]